MSKQYEASSEHEHTPFGAGRETGRLIYNVTVKVEPSIAEKWMRWLLEEHIPEVMATGCFLDYRVVKLLEVDESEGPTYAIQYLAAGKKEYQVYYEQYAALLRAKSFSKWEDRFIAFHTLMEVVG